MKRLFALAAAGVMLCTVPVLAAPSPSAAVIATVAEAAASEGKSVGEYTNNAVAELPGISEVTPIGQGGHVIINGAPSNVIFFLTKPSVQTVSSAKSFAEAFGGRVMNVVGTKSQAVGKFNTAQVNFYTKGVKAGQAIKVYQLINGEWVELKVAEIRDDHVVVNMTAHGILAFVEVPAEMMAAPAAEAETPAAETPAAEAEAPAAETPAAEQPAPAPEAETPAAAEE